MKKISLTSFIFTLIIISATAQTDKGLKVFISVDMEGITGVVHWEEVNRDGKDYDYFRKIMTMETNAAIEGAAAAGATRIIVRDSHGSARNILPDLLDERALLLREWSGGHLGMMEGIDESYDAVIFIGYHAKSGSPNATLDHTMSSVRIRDVSVNGVSLPEAGINALIAGYYDVPVVFLSGDQTIGQQARDLFGEIETVAVKEGIGNAALNLHPEVAQEKIRQGVESALRNIEKYKPYKLKSPYTLVMTLNSEENTNAKAGYPGVERTGAWELTYKHDDIIEVMKAMRLMY